MKTVVLQSSTGQRKDGQIIGTKNSDKVIVHFSTGLRTWGGFFILLGGGLTYTFIAYGFAQDIDADIVDLLGAMWPLIFVFFGIYLLGYTSKFIFDHTRGNLTIKSSVGPVIYRSRTFLKKEELICGVRQETSEAGPSVTLWRVSIRIYGREKGLNIIVNNQRKANSLVKRIEAFKSSE